MKKLLFLLFIPTILFCQGSHVDTLYIGGTSPANYGKIYKGTGNYLYYRSPDGTVARLDSATGLGIVPDSVTFAIYGTYSDSAVYSDTATYALNASSVAGKQDYTDTSQYDATRYWTDSLVTARGVGVGDITAVNTNLPLSGGVTSGAATLSVDTSNTTYGLTTLYRNSLRIARSDTATYSATRTWVATNYPGDITSITVGSGLTGGGSVGAITIGVDTTNVLATQYDLAQAPGDITGVTAGIGLTGGGTSGTVTINADTTNVLATLYDLTQAAGDITSVIAGDGLTGGATSGSATLAIDTSSSRIATQYDITQIDSNKILPYSVASWNVDSAYTIYVGGLAGKIPYFVTAESLSYTNYDAVLLDTTLTNSYTTKAAATNATNLTSGTLPVARLPATGISAGTYSEVTVDVYGRATSGTNIGGGGAGSVTSGDDAFTTTATSDTVSLSGVHSYDQIQAEGIPATPNVLPVAGDLMNVYPDTNRFIVNRAVNTTSGLGYSWMRNAGTFAPPSGVSVATDGDDSLIVSWTIPVTTSASTARSLDSICIAYDTSGYTETIAAAVNKQYTAKTAVKDTIIGLAASKLWYVNVFSYSYADEGSLQSADTRDTCTTGASSETDTIRADEISGLVAWYEGRFITGKNNGDGITSWVDHSAGGYTLDTITGKVGSLPIYYSTVAGQFNGHPAVGFNALNVNDSCAMRSNTVATDSFSGTSIKPMTIFAVYNIPDSAYKQTNYSVFNFSNSSNYLYDIWGGNYRTATLKTMKYAVSAPAPDSADTRSTNLALVTYTLPAHIWTWKYDGDSLTQWIDATKIDSNTTEHWNQSLIAVDRFSIGTKRVLAAKEYYAPINIAAFIIYNRELTDAEITALRGRLKAYYATP